MRRAFNPSEAAALEELQAYKTHTHKPEWLQWDVSPLTVGRETELLGARGACHGTVAATIDGRETAVKGGAADDDEAATVLPPLNLDGHTVLHVLTSLFAFVPGVLALFLLC